VDYLDKFSVGFDYSIIKIYIHQEKNRWQANAKEKGKKLECGPMPNVMATLPNVRGALCSTPQSLADAHY